MTEKIETLIIDVKFKGILVEFFQLKLKENQKNNKNFRRYCILRG